MELNQTTFPQIDLSVLHNISGSERMVVLDMLEEDVEYTVRVRALTGAGSGPYSPAESTVTFEDRELFGPMVILLLHSYTFGLSFI